MGELNDTLSVSPMIAMRDCRRAIEGHEVEIEFCIGVLDLVDEFEAEKLIILDGFFGVFDPQHGVVELVLGRIGRHGCKSSTARNNCDSWDGNSCTKAYTNSRSSNQHKG